MQTTGDLLTDIVLITWEVLKWGIPSSIILYFVVAFFRWKNFPLDAVIIEKRGSNLIKSNDRVGKYYEKSTGITGYRSLKTKDTMPVVDFNWILVNGDKPLNLLEKIVKILRPTAGTIFFFKYGTKQYKPIQIEENGKYKTKYVTIKDKNNEPIMIYSYEQIDPRDKLKTLNFDVVDWDNMNFMVQEQRASAERRKATSEWIKQILIPLAIVGMTVVLSIITIKLSYDHAAAISPKVINPNTNTKPTTPLDGILPGQ